MSYIDQIQDPRRRATSAIAVVVIHGALGLVVVTGLAVSGLSPIPEARIVGIPLSDPLPPPPDPVPTNPVDSKVADPVAPTMPTEFPLTPQAPVYDPFTDDPAFEIVPRGGSEDPMAIPVPPPPPPPAFTPTRARPIGSASKWISTDDYPRRPLVDAIEGTASYRVIISSNGQVSACEITASSGNAQLDATTCRLITRRARFEAATDETGAKVVGSYSGTVRWEIPD